MKVALQTLKHAAQTGRKKLSRRVLRWRMRGQPEADILKAERRLRGQEQLDRLQKADIVVVSFGKSGRTWLRVMMSQFFKIKHQLPVNTLLGFDNFHNLDNSVPKVFFTHDNYIKDFVGNEENKAPFYNKTVILMARDPRDTAVSQYFQWKFRMKPSKFALNNYPPQGSDISLYDFVIGDNGGSMSAVADYLNLWARECDQIERFHLLRYEDLRAEPVKYFSAMLEFLGLGATDQQVSEAVEYASFENMKAMESGQQSKSKLTSGRMKPGDASNPDSYKTRRAKVGGFRDYFDDEQVEAINAKLASTLDSRYGYK